MGLFRRTEPSTVKNLESCSGYIDAILLYDAEADEYSFALSKHDEQYGVLGSVDNAKSHEHKNGQPWDYRCWCGFKVIDEKLPPESRKEVTLGVILDGGYVKDYTFGSVGQYGLYRGGNAIVTDIYLNKCWTKGCKKASIMFSRNRQGSTRQSCRAHSANTGFTPVYAQDVIDKFKRPKYMPESCLTVHSIASLAGPTENL
jgi:hypothetical protein